MICIQSFDQETGEWKKVQEFDEKNIVGYNGFWMFKTPVYCTPAIIIRKAVQRAKEMRQQDNKTLARVVDEVESRIAVIYWENGIWISFPP